MLSPNTAFTPSTQIPESLKRILADTHVLSDKRKKKIVARYSDKD